MKVVIRFGYFCNNISVHWQEVFFEKQFSTIDLFSSRTDLMKFHFRSMAYALQSWQTNLLWVYVIFIFPGQSFSRLSFALADS